MRGIFDAAEAAGLCGGDALIRWAAQGLPAGRGIRAFAAPDGSAVAVASRRSLGLVHRPMAAAFFGAATAG
ncbi:hypothetical protein [Streptomyces sioyaensis]|uniref:hypothetical protein n=1 Tax=Streptomyces sioyaensis TaxID=67364 RepID=UPI0037A51E3E